MNGSDILTLLLSPETPMKRSQPFAAAIALMQVISAALRTANPQPILATLPEYKSRGHGGKHRVMCVQNYRKLATNKFDPADSGTGARECQRRMRQQQRQNISTALVV